MKLGFSFFLLLAGVLLLLGCASLSPPSELPPLPSLSQPEASPTSTSPEGANEQLFQYGLLTTVGNTEEVFLNPLTVYPLLSWDLSFSIRRSSRQPPLDYLLYYHEGEVFVRQLAENDEGESFIEPPIGRATRFLYAGSGEREQFLGAGSFDAQLPADYAAIIAEGTLDDRVLYGLYNSKDRQNSNGEEASDTGGPELTAPLLRFTFYDGPAMLHPQSFAQIAISQYVPRWLPLLGNEGYGLEVKAESQLLIQTETQRNRLSHEEFENLYLRPGEYEYRIRPLYNEDAAWSEWTAFSTTGSLIVVDEAPLDYYGFVPGIGPEEVVAQPTEDERFPLAPEARANFAVEPGHLPAFFLEELSNEQAATLLTSGLRDGSLLIGTDEFGHSVLKHSDIIVLGLDSLYYGIQLGLELITDKDDGVYLSPAVGYASHPVTGVTWFGALYLANLLSLQLGLEPVYLLEDLHWDREKRGVRLPTEMEWELYARLNEAELNNSEANYFRSFDPWEDVTFPHNRNAGPTVPVDWGSGNLLGNVWEWCWDWYDEDAYDRYASLTRPALEEMVSDLNSDKRRMLLATNWHDQTNELADELATEAEQGTLFLRALRGAAWNSQQESLRISNRGQFDWDLTSWSVGLRFVIDR